MCGNKEIRKQPLALRPGAKEKLGVQLSEIGEDWGLYLAAMVLLALRRMLSPCTGWNSSGWAGGQWPPCLWLRPIRALIFLSTFITAAHVCSG